MWEKIPYHDWNDGVDLWILEIKKIEINKTKWDLDLMKIALKNNIIAELNYNMPKVHSIFIERELLSEENWKIFINLTKITKEDFDKLVNYKNNLFNIFENDIKNNIIFSDEETDLIFKDVNSVYLMIEEIEGAFMELYKKL